MRIAGLAAFMGMSILSLLAPSAPASAQADCKTVVAPSPFGPDDQTGATNRVTPAVTKAAAAEIQTGVVTPMANNLVDGVPLFGTRFSKTILSSFAVVPGAEYGKNKLSYMEDTYLSQSHVGTHIDGMGHIGIQDCYYNQTPMGKYVTQNYLKRLGIENIKTFATRGVIIDAVKVFQAAGKLKPNAACKNPCLDAGTVITEADLQAGLKMYNVTLREADAVFINTGWGDLFQQFPAQNATYNGGEPGISKSAAMWLASQKVVAVGTDTWAVEVIPGEDTTEAFPVHKILLTDNGIHIIENVRTDLISAAAASSNRATFFLSMTVPKAVGLTGTFVNIEAIQ
ncbi:MAG TPA: cyclase family protein [Acetobacteraceae bacterium]|jgi:kynurenine formamidase|nr:cyclase family protein [Acetobacteraceae bacterium]